MSIIHYVPYWIWNQGQSKMLHEKPSAPTGNPKSKSQVSLRGPRSQTRAEIIQRMVRPPFKWSSLSSYLCRNSLVSAGLGHCWPLCWANLVWTLTVAPLCCCSSIPEPRSQLVSSRGAQQRCRVTPKPWRDSTLTVLWTREGGMVVKGSIVWQASMVSRAAHDSRCGSEL